MDISDKSLQELITVIEESKTGFDIDILDKWYFRIIEYAKEEAPHPVSYTHLTLPTTPYV